MRKSRVWSGLVGAAIMAGSAAAQQASFTAIPDLPGGSFLSRARAISRDGGVVAGMSNSANGDEAMRWILAAPDAGGLGDVAGGVFSSDGYACSGDGSVVYGAGTNASGNNEAFRWTVSGGLVSLGFLPTGGYVSRAYGSSADGAIACGENLFQPTGVPPPLPITQAFIWTQAGGMQGLGFLPGNSFYSTARAMSADGSVIVGWAEDASGVNRPFRWTAATGMVDFGNGQVTGTARGVSSDGSWIVGSDSTTAQAYRWSEAAGFEELGVIAGRTSSAAAGVSADGKRIAGVCSGGAGQVACLWKEGYGGCGVPASENWATIADLLSFRGISTAGWTLQVALGISDDGYRIVGYGLNPAGQTQAWLAYLPPAPPQCGYADYNCDGDVGTDADIESFFSCIAGSCPPPPCCSTADFNGDGDVGTDADIEAFFRVLAGGGC